jgi:hypothetical protein
MLPTYFNYLAKTLQAILEDTCAHLRADRTYVFEAELGVLGVNLGHNGLAADSQFAFGILHA